MRGWLAISSCMVGCLHSGPKPYLEHKEPGVVVLATGEIQPDNELSVELVITQLTIADKAAHNGPVVVLTPNEDTARAIVELCDGFGDLCKELKEGAVTIDVVPHDTAWVRDYGPFINVKSDREFVLDAKYVDGERAQFDALRAANIEQRARLLDNTDPAARQEFEQLTRMYRNMQARVQDDDTPASIARAAFRDDSIQVEHPALHLDGGNLFRVENGTCLTTTDVLVQNGNDRSGVERVLQASYRCERIVFLTPLPGDDIIKHVDMFLMPVAGRRVLLANIDIASLQESRLEMSDDLWSLTQDAAKALDEDGKLLETAGFIVIPVPALPPRSFGGTRYFPTLLNGLVQVGRDGRRHVLLPTYDPLNQSEAKIITTAQAIMQKSFGSDVDITTIDATAAAILQGAIHCLTLEVPLAHSTFEAKERVATAVNAAAENVDSAIARAGTSCINQMRGTWNEEGAQRTLVLSADTLTVTDAGGNEDYTGQVRCDPNAPLTAHLVLSDGQAVRLERAGLRLLVDANGERHTFVRLRAHRRASR